VKSGSKFPAGKWPNLPIRTSRLVLRLPEMSDVETIHRSAAHPSTRWGVHLLPRPYLRRHAVEFVKRKRTQFRRRESLALAITLGDDGSLVGMIELSHLSPADRCAELGYWIALGQRGQGYATEAARAMCDIGFRSLRLHRIEARAFARNRASIRVLEKAGLRHEGRFRERVRFGRSWLDQVWLARLAVH
jgi:[ribosomal protein S5]-alanine N-acetyltransferase